MGNCLPSRGYGHVSAHLVGREEFIMVTRSDGKIMEFTAPLVVKDLISAYPQHSVVHSQDEKFRSLSPNQKLVPGQLYRLLLIPNSPSSLTRTQNGSGIMRVHMVISEQELQALLSDPCTKEKSLFRRRCFSRWVSPYLMD